MGRTKEEVGDGLIQIHRTNMDKHQQHRQHQQQQTDGQAWAPCRPHPPSHTLAHAHPPGLEQKTGPAGGLGS